MKIFSTLTIALLGMTGSLMGQSLSDQPSGAQAENEARLKPIDCVAVARAHAALLSGCFSARRELSATINQKLALHELAVIKYRAGQLDIEVIEREQPNKLVSVGGEGDMVAQSQFACERLTLKSSGQYVLAAADDPERIFFDYDEKQNVLLPRRWEFEEQARFLFKKFHIRAYANYSDVSFGCDSVSTTDS